MVSYTANKGFGVPTVGADYNLWCNEINTDLGILDTNLGGQATINCAGNSNVTATTVQAQNMALTLTGALTGNIEVILPAVRRAVSTTRSGRIGVLGTQATVASGAYQDAFAAARDTEVTAVACPRFVDFVERGITSGRQVLGLAEGYLEPLQRADVDTLVLGCTHYPLLSGLIQLAMGDAVTLVSSAEETAKDLLRVLTERDLLHPHPERPAAGSPLRVFEATGDPEAVLALAARFLGPAITGVGPVHRHIAASGDLTHQ